MKVLIEMTGEGRLACSPIDYLGGSFGDYLAATKSAGAVFDKATKRQVLPAEKAGQLLGALTASGFIPQATDEAKAVLARRADEMEKEAASVASELNARLAELAERGYSLFGFQEDGVRWLMNRQHALLGDDMGLGKTVQTLVSLPAGAPVLVVAKTKTLRAVWRNHAREWAPHFDVSVIRRRDDFRWPEAGEVVVISAHTLPAVARDSGTKKWSLVDDIGMPLAGTVVVADEAHAFKASTAQRTQSMRKVCAKVRRRSGSIWLLSGTPMEKNPQELYNVLQLGGLATEAFGGWGRYTDLFNAYRGRFGWEWGLPSAEVPKLLSRVMLRRTRDDELDLPPIRYQRAGVDIDPADSEAIRKAEEDLRWKGVDLDLIKTAEDLRHVESVAFEAMSRLRTALATAKVPAMLDIASEYEEAGEPLVVFSCHREPVDVLAKREGWAAVHGGIDSDDRDAAIAAFQAGELKGLAVTVATGAEGITLTRAAHMLIVDLPWNPSVMDQVTARVHRISQERDVLVRILVADHVLDERVDDLHASKRAVVESSVDAAGKVERVPDTAVLRSVEAVSAPCGDADAASGSTPAQDVLDALGRIPAGRYALPKADGDGLAFWKLDMPTEGRWEGWAFLHQQVGPEFARYGAIRPDGSVTNPAAGGVVMRIAENPAEAMTRYGREIGQCGICGRALTDEESRRAGIGPVCARKFA